MTTPKSSISALELELELARIQLGHSTNVEDYDRRKRLVHYLEQLIQAKQNSDRKS